MTWLAAAVAGVVVRAIAARLPGARSTEARFARSWVIPTVGVALLLPLTLHMPVFLLLASRRTFDDWVMSSLVVTGPTHLVFASLSARRARDLVLGWPAMSPSRIYALTVLL